jgi:hypothetical protein
VRIEFDPAVITFSTCSTSSSPSTIRRRPTARATTWAPSIARRSSPPRRSRRPRPARSELAGRLLRRAHRHRGLAAPTSGRRSPITTTTSAATNQPYCQYVVAPKVAKFRSKFAKRVKAT